VATPTFPRLPGARSRIASIPRFPSALQAWSQSGKGQLRAVQNMGRVWRETYPLLDLSNPNVRALVQAINQSIREGTIWNVQHPYWQVRKGVGGGSAVINSPPQLVTQPENFGHADWTIWVGTPTLTSGQGDPFGGTAAYQINDDSAASPEAIQATVAFTGDGTKSIALFLRAGTATKTTFGIFDNTAAAWRAQVDVTWTAGVPSAAIVTGGGSVFPIEVIGGGWYRIAVSVNSVVAGNSNRFLIYGADTTNATTGTTFIFGANAWNSVTSAAYRGPSNPGPAGNPTGQMGSSLYIRGGPNSTTAWLRAGDLIQVAGATVVFDGTGQVDTNGVGGAIIPISPPIFEGASPPDGAVVEINPANIFFRAVLVDVQDLPNIDTTSYIDPGMTLTWRELPL